MRRPFRELCLALFGLLLTSTVALAQLSTAQLSGRVTDESNAVLPGVTVTATQTDTGFVRSDVTDGSGAYILSNLPTGPYRLEAALQGFRTYVQTGIVLQVAGSPVVNVTFSPASRSFGPQPCRRTVFGLVISRFHVVTLPALSVTST